MKRSVDKLCSSDPGEKKEAGAELEKGNTETIRQLLVRDIKAECGKDEEKYYLLGDTYFAAKQPDYKKALENYLQAAHMNPNNTTYLNSIGLALYQLENHKKAIEYFEKALAIDLKIYGDEHPTVAIRWNNLGGAWDSLGEYKKTLRYYEKALKIFKATLGPNHPYTKTAQNNLYYLQ